MDASREFEEVLTQIKEATDLAELSAVLMALRERYVLANIVYHAVSIPSCDTANPILLLTYEDEWVRRYIERDYFRTDPVVRTGRKGFLPLDWSDVDRESLKAQHFFREADAYEVGREGVTLPIRGPAGERALFTVTSNLSKEEWIKKRSLYIREFQIIGHFVHDRAVELSGYRKDRPRLSSREAQCLTLIAEGQHIKQIAAQLNLSTSAVQLYLQSARHKLKCANIPEAAVKAVSLELIERVR